MLIGLAAGLGYQSVFLYSWVYAAYRLASMPMVGLLVWGASGLFLALNWAIIGALGRLLAEGRGALRPWAWAALWTAVTFFSERWTPRPCADILGYTQWRYLPLLQASSLVGPHFLGFLIVAANAILEDIWARPTARTPQAAANLAAALALLAGTWAYGIFALARRGSPGPAARVEILQTAVDQRHKSEVRYRNDILFGFDELLSRPRAAPPALVIWPETCIPYEVRVDWAPEKASAWSRRLGAFQIVGAATREDRVLRNSALLVSPSGELAGAYHKRVLVPFWEFEPLGSLSRFIGSRDPLSELTAGAPAQPLFELPFGRAAASICYETTFPRLARADAARGARLLVNITNDVWFKGSWEPHQHFWASAFRAIENRMTVLICTNCGISGAIDPWGVVLARQDTLARGRLDVAVPLGDAFPQGSFYARHGDWFGTLCLLASGMLAALAFQKKRRTNS